MYERRVVLNSVTEYEREREMRQGRGSRGEADKRQRTVGVPVCICNWQGYKPTHCVTWWEREKEKLGKKSQRESE